MMPGEFIGNSRYSEPVQRYFASTAHAGELAGPAITVCVQQPGSGSRISLSGAFEAGQWQRLCYRVFGCPHLIAAAEWACERFEGRPVEVIRRFPVTELMQELAIPVEKTGRILLLEDAFVQLDEKRTRALESGG